MVGRARAGKDSVAGRLVDRYGFVRYAFADELKRAALALDPIVTPVDTVAGSVRLSELVALVGWEAAKEHREVRRLLQHYGVAIRDIEPDFWVRAVMRHVEREPRPVVITDVRFPNEAGAIEAVGGVLVRVIRPGQDESDQHVSETALRDCSTDFELTNDGDFHSLLKKVDNLAPHL
ncbi:hypothetical protein [Micromonospora sp. WMMD980]|uniref:deoxynucleotide monophosphate kinase family protein n=1 Tax=Micromonospora sp. WMMD980 TaxID=3016088 RepID=UPI002416F98B|nr:hypothetical protein [Micromonospora sp. WMMD980]MDG4801735.1 hypothetical protein [Micromonospora sp. WMMD980]